MTSVPPFPDVPRELPARAGGKGKAFVLSDDFYAVHDRDPGAPSAGAELVLDAERIAVFRVRASGGDAVAKAGPVYAAPGGPLAVPTGRVFVRFAPGTDAASRSGDLARAGYVIEKIPGSAPHAAWVVAKTGGIAAALRGLPALERLPGVENVEPQLLMEAVRRR